MHSKFISMADVRENFEISKEDPKYMICTICGSKLSKDSKETTFQKHLETKKHLKELNSLDIERKEEFNDAEIVTENETLEKLEEERVPSFFVPLERNEAQDLNNLKYRLDALLDRKKENDLQKRNLKQKFEALEKIRESFKTEETEELETFVHFKVTARPEAFREMIDHMKFLCLSQEADGVISALSVQESGAENVENAEIVTEDKTLELLEDERGPSFFVPLIPHTKSSNGGNETGRKDQKNQNINSENYDKGSNVQDKKETCKFLKFGKCRHGLSGKEPDQGKVCSYKHHPVCRDHEKWGKCFENRCIKYHLKSCREFMNNQYCSYGDNCKFWHPTGLKEFRMDHERKEHYSKEEIPSELKNSRVFYGKNHSYLRQQGNLRQNPFLDLNQGQNSQRTFLELERQKKIAEIVRILEQNKQ